MQLTTNFNFFMLTGHSGNSSSEQGDSKTELQCSDSSHMSPSLQQANSNRNATLFLQILLLVSGRRAQPVYVYNATAQNYDLNQKRNKHAGHDSHNVIQ